MFVVVVKRSFATEGEGSQSPPHDVADLLGSDASPSANGSPLEHDDAMGSYVWYDDAGHGDAERDSRTWWYAFGASDVHAANGGYSELAARIWQCDAGPLLQHDERQDTNVESALPQLS